MRISARVDYAVRALVEIARAGPGRLLTAQDVAIAQHIPRNFLLVIMADLRRAGLVRSQRGQGGGWMLARPAETISVADLLRATDGPLMSIQGQQPESVGYESSAAALQQVWCAALSSVREIFEDVTLAHLVRGELPAQVLARIHQPATARRSAELR